MLKHSDPEVQFLVEMLEGQRDQAIAKAAELFCANRDLADQLARLKQTEES